MPVSCDQAVVVPAACVAFELTSSSARTAAVARRKNATRPAAIEGLTVVWPTSIIAISSRDRQPEGEVEVSAIRI